MFVMLVEDIIADLGIIITVQYRVFNLVHVCCHGLRLQSSDWISCSPARENGKTKCV